MRIIALFFFIGLALAGCASTANIPTLGSSYDKGTYAFEDKNYAEARRQWASSVNEGEVLALNSLGYLLYCGLGGPAEPEKAVALWKRGAEAGHAEAQWHFGKAYEDGKGAEKDYAQAYAWYRCALESDKGDTGRVRRLEVDIAAGVQKSISLLLDKLSPAQFAEGSRLAKEYIARYSKLGANKPWL